MKIELTLLKSGKLATGKDIFSGVKGCDHDRT